jgi:antitoxin component of RelBE/YafQ-DinJ toxin-antitoxin module
MVNGERDKSPLASGKPYVSMRIADDIRLRADALLDEIRQRVDEAISMVLRSFIMRSSVSSIFVFRS